MITDPNFEPKEKFLAFATTDVVNDHIVDEMLKIDGIVFNGRRQYMPTQFNVPGTHEGFHFTYTPLNVSVLLTLAMEHIDPNAPGDYIQANEFLVSHFIENDIVKVEDWLQTTDDIQFSFELMIKEFENMKAKEKMEGYVESVDSIASSNTRSKPRVL